MIHNYLRPLMHYVCIGFLLVMTYFLGDSFFNRHHFMGQTQVVASAPAPAGVVGRTAQTVADVMTNQALAAALHNEDIQLSEAQQTVANTISAYTGISSRLAGAAAYGLTQPSPKQQVITVATTADKKATFTTPTPGPSDDQVKRDMKEVLATTTVNANVKTSVDVTYQDRPFSPISAVYTGDGSSGIGYMLHRAPAVSVDALALINHGKPEVGAAVEHIIKGTSLGIGIGATYNFATRSVNPQAVVLIHF